MIILCRPGWKIERSTWQCENVRSVGRCAYVAQAGGDRFEDSENKYHRFVYDYVYKYRFYTPSYAYLLQL